MIEINLLPHREARRAADLRQSVALLVLGLVLAGGGITLVHGGMKDRLSQAQAQVRQLQADIARYGPQQKKVAEFKQTKSALESKLNVLKSLENARNGPVRILDELSNHTPERLWLTSLETRGNQITLQGESLDTGVVADFLRNMNGSKFFVNVDLDKTARGKEVEGVRLVTFVITADLANPVTGKDATDA